MKPFLTYVAEDIIAKYGTNLSDIVVVFPNKRASLFLNDSLAHIAEHPIWSPTYITISDLFRQFSNLKVGDPIKLVCDLHKSFMTCTGMDEPLDHFYGWGQLLISDFDDIDKNLVDGPVDVDKLFANLRDLHELDDVSYLTEEQKKSIKKFFSNFSEEHNTELKKRFLQLWSHLADIYHDFNQRLVQQGITYEGALYKKVANDECIKFTHKKYLFVGFNMLHKVERKLIDRLKKEGKAAFYWDYDAYYMGGKGKKADRAEAGHYIRQYLSDYPNELADCPQDELYNNLVRKKDIAYISAATENIQARYVSTWLLENNRYLAGRQTAIVLADEKLLQAVIHSLPKELDSVNITLGYPLQQTPFYSLLQHLVNLQTKGRTKSQSASLDKGKETYRLSFVNKVLRHPYARYISARYLDLLSDLEQEKRFYPTRESLCMDGDDGLQTLFKDIEAGDDYNLALVSYLMDVLRTIGVNARSVADHLFQESLFRTYTVINRLRELIATGDLSVDIITLEGLIKQVIQSTTIPFHGEPAEGVQIMGVLETRNLDFEHVLVLSCNEGNIPKGVKDSSFIPYSLRKAYELTTVDNKVAIYAYYFHRLIQRADDLTLTYNNSTEDGQRGEMSEFMIQLLVESPHPILRKTLVAGQTPRKSDKKNIQKTDQIIQKLNTFGESKCITPTFLNTYMSCQKKFYFKYIEGLRELDEQDEDEMDNRVFGLIFHRAAELFYLRLASQSCIATNTKGEQKIVHPVRVTKEQVEYALKHKEYLEGLVDESFREHLFKVKKALRKSDYNGLQLINREVIISYLKQLLTIDKRLTPFYILGLEMMVEKEFTFKTSLGEKRLRMGGVIDRLDRICPDGDEVEAEERIRVIDYKTGGNVASVRNVEAIFHPNTTTVHSDYYLQAFIYSLIVKSDQHLNPNGNPVSPALLFIQKAGAKDYDPTLSFGKETIYDAASWQPDIMSGLTEVMEDLFNPNLPFVPTEDERTCNNCPYGQLCKG